MFKILKNSSLVFIIFILIFTTLSLKAEAFSLTDINPIPFLHKTTDIIVNRISDMIYYLIMQKKYIFDNYVDPNNYPSLNISDSAKKIFIATTTNKNIGVATTSALPIINITYPVVSDIVQDLPQSNPTVSVPTPLIIKSNSISSVPNVSVLNYSSDSQILSATNIERAKISLVPLSANYVLDNIASLRVDDLFNNQYFEHDSPDGLSVTDLAKKNNYDYIFIGENLALGNFDNDQDIVSAWMESPGHKANILNERFKELGVSVKEGTYNGENVIIAVQVFGSPLASCGKPSLEIKVLIDTSHDSIKEMQTQALEMFNHLSEIKNSPGIDRNYYYQKIQEYNYFAKKTNDAILVFKNMVDLYNLEVNKYNSCIGS